VAISINNNLEHLVRANKSETMRPSAQRAGRTGSFNEVLQNCLQEAGFSLTAGSDLPPLDKNQLALLVKNIQMQMNRQLFQAVFSNGESVNFALPRILPHFVQEAPPSFPEVSKNRQASSKNDVKESDGTLDELVARAAHQYQIDPDLVRSVIRAESNFNPHITSHKGAMGLMQLMPETAKDLGVKNAYDPEENVMGGTRYLKSLLNRYDGNVDLALAAYNWGMGNVERNSQSLPRETTNYIAKINRYYKDLKALG